MLTVEVGGTEMASLPLTLERGVVSVEREIEYRDGALWSPANPVLHTIRVTLGEDDLIDRFGIREVATEGPQILINGESIRLLGFCRHEAHPQFGCGLPAALQIEDLQLLRDMGCNFVRGSHYPQDPRFLDLCDEQGICVWSEATGWQHTTEHFADPRFIEAQLQNIREMIGTAANRPSVLVWGLQNESHSEDDSNRVAYETLIGEIRRLDTTRPVTYASNRWPNDRFHDLIDIISFNTYPGWYRGEIDDLPVLLDGIVEAIDASASAGKPVIVSEIGAGAVPGWVDRNAGRWSEQYQAELLERVIDHLFVDTDRVCGIAIWQFCDCRTAELVGKTLSRPRGFNNKGVLDEYRRPKRAYDVVKRRFTSL
jgi:beta-glucuronidase